MYGSVEEIVHRFRIFINSVDLIMSHNSKKLPYQLGINGELIPYIFIHLNSLLNSDFLFYYCQPTYRVCRYVMG